MSPERLLAIMSNERPSTFKWIYAAGAVTLVLIAIFAVMFAVQEHNDRVLFDEITETSSELQDTGARVMSIRDAGMKDMNDYIRAYSRMELFSMTMTNNSRESRISATKPPGGSEVCFAHRRRAESGLRSHALSALHALFPEDNTRGRS